MIKALLANMEGSTDPDEAGDSKSKEELFSVLEQYGVLIAARCNADEVKDLRTWMLRVAALPQRHAAKEDHSELGAFASATTNNLLFQESMQQFLLQAETDPNVSHHLGGPFKRRSRDDVRSFRSCTEIRWTFRDFLGSRSADKFDDSSAARKPWTSEDPPWNEAATDPFVEARTLCE